MLYNEDTQFEDKVTKREKGKGLRYIQATISHSFVRKWKKSSSTNYDYARNEIKTGRMKNGGN